MMGCGEENLWVKFKFPSLTLTRDINTNIVVLLIDLFYELSPFTMLPYHLLHVNNNIFASSPIIFMMPFK
jgi:hypothetical protein